MSFVCHSYVIRMSIVCNGMSLVFTCMSSVCHYYVLVCHACVTCMYWRVIRMSLLCTRMPSVCYLHVLVCHPYITRMIFCHEPLLTMVLGLVWKRKLINWYLLWDLLLFKKILCLKSYSQPFHVSVWLLGAVYMRSNTGWKTGRDEFCSAFIWSFFKGYGITRQDGVISVRPFRTWIP